MALTMDDADRMVKAAIAKAKDMNINLSVAVCDGGGHLLAFNRMESCIWISASVAQGKAVAACGLGRPSGEIAADSPVIQAIIATQGGRMVPAQPCSSATCQLCSPWPSKSPRLITEGLLLSGRIDAHGVRLARSQSCETVQEFSPDQILRVQVFTIEMGRKVRVRFQVLDLVASPRLAQKSSGWLHLYPP